MNQRRDFMIYVRVVILTLAFCCCCCWDIENGEYSFVERLDSLQYPALLGDFLGSDVPSDLGPILHIW